MSTLECAFLSGGSVEGEVVYCAEGLSFWGGVDPDTGDIIDAHHPNHGTVLSGKIVLMPTSRGSCSGSGVLLQLARNGHAPAALVFCEEENILTLGAMIAERLFEASVTVVRVTRQVFDALSLVPRAHITPSTLSFDATSVPLVTISADMLDLSAADRDMLAGSDGNATQIAMEVLCQIAAAQAAQDFVNVTCAHIDGCILAHDANLDFAEKMHALGARTRVPTTINAISVDRENWQTQGVVPDFGLKASRLADAYVKMGARPTFTCAPYLLDDHPAEGDVIGWSESNAVIYANSVLGARTVKHPDYLDLFIAMTGRAPNTGVYLEENRIAACEIQIALPTGYDDALWPMLGWLVGTMSPNQIPLLTGLESADPGTDDLKALCAAFGTTSAAPMLHVRGHTPEGHLDPSQNTQTLHVTPDDLAQVWQTFNAAPEAVDLVAIGSPHASLTECRLFANLLDGQNCHEGTTSIVTVGREVLAQARAEGIVAHLEHAGVKVFPDICWCSITEPIFPPEAKVLITNSGKYSHYASGLTGRGVRFGSMADCAKASLTGRASKQLPDWLVQT